MLTASLPAIFRKAWSLYRFQRLLTLATGKMDRVLFADCLRKAWALMRPRVGAPFEVLHKLGVAHLAHDRRALCAALDALYERACRPPVLWYRSSVSEMREQHRSRMGIVAQALHAERAALAA